MHVKTMIPMTMGLSEKAIQFAVLRLSAQKETYSLDDIAAFIGCATRTVKNTMPKLIRAGVIVRTGNARVGYRYILIEDSQNAKTN